MHLKQFNLRRSLSFRLKQVFWLLISWLFFTTFFPWPSYLKVLILRIFGARIGSGVILRPNIYVKIPWNLFIGSDVWIGYGVHIDNDELVSIGGSTCVSQYSKIFTGSHDFSSDNFEYNGAQVMIGEGCWIAACCIILPGVEIQKATFLKAGSITKKGKLS